MPEIDGQSPDVTYSCIRGGWEGIGNLSDPPRFANVFRDDYRLLNGSSCIDAGTEMNAPHEDIDGNLRPGCDGKVDIGAYESPEEFISSGYIPKVIYVRSDGDAVIADGLSWGKSGSFHSARDYDRGCLG